MINELKISFVGPSGSGKSTAAEFTGQYLLTRGFQVTLLNVAQPLHNIQSIAYHLFDRRNTGQDGALLQFLAEHFQDSLGSTFQRNLQLALERSPRPLAIINSDCRDNVYSTLRDLDFKFVRILTNPETIAKRLRQRGDLTPASSTHPVEAINRIHPNFLVGNNDSLPEFCRRLQLIIDYLTTSKSS